MKYERIAKPITLRWRAWRNLLGLIGVSLVMTGCEEENSVFERRYVLTEIPGFEAEDYLAFLDSPDPNLRYLGMANLMAAGGFPPPDADDQDDEAKEINARVLGLLEDPGAKVRAISAFAVSPWEDAESESGLIALLNDPSPAVRVEALASLAARPEMSPKATEGALAALEDENILVRLHAIEALGTACSADRTDAVANRLAEFLVDRELPEKLSTLSTLGGVDAEASEAVLLAVLRDSEDQRTLDIAVTSLSILGTPGTEAEALVVRALQENRGSPLVLLEFLAEHGTELSQEFIVAGLEDKNEEISEMCLKVLMSRDDEKALAIARDFLVTRIASLEPTVADLYQRPGAEDKTPVQQLAGALGGLDLLKGEETRLDPSTIETLLRSETPYERWIGMSHLMGASHFDAPPLGVTDRDSSEIDLVGALAPLTKAKSPVERAMVMETLAGSRDPRAVEWLAAGFEDPVFEVRFQALQGIVQRAQSTGDSASLLELYGQRESISPDRYDESDAGFVLRTALEEGLASLTPVWTNRERDLRDLAAENSPVTRLLAAARLSDAGRSEAVDVLLTFLESGTEEEKNFVVATLHPSLIELAQLPRLKKVRDAETDENRRAVLTELLDTH